MQRKLIGDHQCGFRHNMSTSDQIFHIHQIFERMAQLFMTSIKFMIHLGGRSSIIFSMSLVSP